MNNPVIEMKQHSTFQKLKISLPDKKPVIFIFIDYYSPGFKAGGPIRSCINFVEYMKEEYDVYIYTRDRDINDSNPYTGIIADQWINKQKGVYTFYASPASLSWKYIKKSIDIVAPDYIYLNSMYSQYFTLYPLLMKFLGGVNAKIVLAPRGMLKESAIKYKQSKKKIFLRLLRLFDFQTHFYFHATDATEVNDIRKYFGDKVEIFHIPNFHGFQKAFLEPIRKDRDQLKIVFVGRIHPIKNLHFLLLCLKNVKASVQLTIIGPIEYITYWKMCVQLAQELPKNITVNWLQGVPPQELENILLEHHLFCLPTEGENFGHAIFEALAVGRPVLISDQTPWRNLDNINAGWDLSLNYPTSFINAIERIATIDHETFNAHCKAAWQYCHNYIAQSNIKEQYRQLFN